MDASNRYAMMCQKAEEIQSLWKPRQCDFIINLEDLEEGLSFCKKAESMIQVVDMYYQDSESTEYRQEAADLKESSLWLPRQDQLQKILEPDNTKVHLIMKSIIESHYYEYSKETFVAAPEIYYSMEQMWIGYIMKENYNKMWNEEEWVLIEKQ